MDWPDGPRIETSPRKWELIFAREGSFEGRNFPYRPHGQQPRHTARVNQVMFIAIESQINLRHVYIKPLFALFPHFAPLHMCSLVVLMAQENTGTLAPGQGNCGSNGQHKEAASNGTAGAKSKTKPKRPMQDKIEVKLACIKGVLSTLLSPCVVVDQFGVL
jgi:hypothetical protein